AVWCPVERDWLTPSATPTTIAATASALSAKRLVVGRRNSNRLRIPPPLLRRGGVLARTAPRPPRAPRAGRFRLYACPRRDRAGSSSCTTWPLSSGSGSSARRSLILPTIRSAVL